jgi:hypothetical protein
MDRFERRLLEAENIISIEKKKRKEKEQKEREQQLLHARFHATAVAAILLSGEAKIDEPLSEAWARALQHYKISLSHRWIIFGEKARLKDQVAAAQLLFPLIVGGAEGSVKFAEIFSTAPAWLLTFTGTFFDSVYLNFELPCGPGKFKWGRAGYAESQQWPLLPWGRLTDGDPLPEVQWPCPLRWMEAADSTPDVQDSPPQEEEVEDVVSPELKRAEVLELALDLAKNPEKDKELSRYDKIRLRSLFEEFERRRRARQH